LRAINGEQVENRNVLEKAEILHAARAAMSAVRTAAGGVPEIWSVPDLFPQIGGSGAYSRRAQGQLVNVTGSGSFFGRESWELPPDATPKNVPDPFDHKGQKTP
jgi:hypothetical protein